MKFVLVDRILELEPGRRIVTHKALSRAEEYLADHFPRFPVLPGVLMLEAAVQSAAWLVRASLDFAVSLVLLKEARNVTYNSFVAPGEVLRIEAVCKQLAPAESVFWASGQVGGRQCLKGELTLRHLDLAGMDAEWGALDQSLRARARALLDLLRFRTPEDSVAV